MLTVLIVEDEAIIRKGLKFSYDWADMGCTVVGEAEGGCEGLEKILTVRPDIVLTDIKMPKMSGLEMLEKACAEYRFSSIVMTSYAEFGFAHKALELQIVGYLLKPVVEQKLRDVVKLATDQHKQRKLVDEMLDGKTEFNRLDFVLSTSNAGIENYYVQQAIDTAKCRYRERLSLADLALDLHVSESYLAHKFKEEVSCSFHEYINRYRIMKAVELLHQSKYRINEIAVMTGFSQYKQFSVVFKKYVGISPTQFVKKF